MIVFFDTNVLYDVIGQRAPHYKDSFALWSLAEQGRIEGHVSAISFNNIHYVVERHNDAKHARLAVKLLRDTFHVVPLDARILNQALDSPMRDFEDAIQYFSALHADASCILTRNPRHFPTDGPPVLSPAQFLKAHFDG